MTMESLFVMNVVNAADSLNPCYNGMTMELKSSSKYGEVKNRLNPCYNGMTME